jgi:excisionase family DNA binding protein
MESPARGVTSIEDTYLTVTEIAQLLDLHTTTVRDLICRGELPAYQPAGKRYRVTVKAFLSYLDRKGNSLCQRARMQRELRSLFTRSPR